MTPTTKELIFCRIETLKSEIDSIKQTIERCQKKQDELGMDFIEIWEIDIECLEIQIQFLKKKLFHS